MGRPPTTTGPQTIVVGEVLRKEKRSPDTPEKACRGSAHESKAPPELLNLDGARGARREPAESYCSGKNERLARCFSRALIKLRAEPAEAAFWPQQRR